MDDGLQIVLRRSDGWEKVVEATILTDVYVYDTPLSTIEFEQTEEDVKGLPVFVQVRERMKRA